MDNYNTEKSQREEKCCLKSRTCQLPFTAWWITSDTAREAGDRLDPTQTPGRDISLSEWVQLCLKTDADSPCVHMYRDTDAVWEYLGGQFSLVSDTCFIDEKLH